MLTLVYYQPLNSRLYLDFASFSSNDFFSVPGTNPRHHIAFVFMTSYVLLVYVLPKCVHFSQFTHKSNKNALDQSLKTDKKEH